jgi:RNA recognition motif-containing protein
MYSQEERRIVYVGRIPSSYTRRDLRRKFESFGEITDVSVHFREHGYVLFDARLAVFIHLLLLLQR